MEHVSVRLTLDHMMRFIWTANELHPLTFDAPTFSKINEFDCEEYSHVRIIDRLDSVSFVAKTKHGIQVLRDTAKALDIHLPDEFSD